MMMTVAIAWIIGVAVILSTIMVLFVFCWPLWSIPGAISKPALTNMVMPTHKSEKIKGRGQADRQGKQTDNQTDYTEISDRKTFLFSKYPCLNNLRTLSLQNRTSIQKVR